MKKLLVNVLSAVLIVAMVLSPTYTYQSKAFTEEETEWIAEAKEALYDILEEKDVMAVVYLADRYPVRTAPGEDASVVIEVPSGQSVFIKDVELTEDYEAWVEVRFNRQDSMYSGYVQRKNLACSDELFLQWEMGYGMNPGAYMTMFALGDEEVPRTYEDIEQFPESYKAALTELKEAHPNWVFVKMDTGLDWDTVVTEELKGGRSLISASLGGYLQEGKFSTGWSYATREALEYYLDPRNSLKEKEIFQFEQLTFNESYHMDCEAAVQRFLDNTFMKDKVPDTVMTYAFVFWAIGKEQNISPFHLASRVYQEQGRGTSPLISGTYPGYEGYYNYFNIGASGRTNQEVIENGLKYAKEHGWDSAYNGLYYGSIVIGSNYISKGQDTLYLQKFDVDNSNNGLYWHQYMQNISAPTSEAKSIYRLYEETGSLDNVFVFKIPVYQNMPEECPLPESSDRVILTAPEGYTDTTVYVDGIAYEAETRNGYVIAQGAGLEGKTAVMYQYNESGVPVGMTVWELENAGNYYKATEMEGLKDLLTYHGFSIRITGRAGIRFKTGIGTQTREQLLGDGISGYQLKEYGTLVTNNANLGTYPMINGGEKISNIIAYGMSGDGELTDNIFSIVNDRYHYTAVLVGIPAKYYKTEFAFRGYATLTKGEEEITIYGPIRYRSIYSLAEQALSLNMFEENSDAWNFLKQLIADGDNPPQETPEPEETGEEAEEA
mgnify:CR=1 FL=1